MKQIYHIVVKATFNSDVEICAESEEEAMSLGTELVQEKILEQSVDHGDYRIFQYGYTLTETISNGVIPELEDVCYDLSANYPNTKW